MSLSELTATAAVQAIRSGENSSVELTKACLDRIAEREPEVQAWAFLDPAYALQQAEERDAARREGRPLGPLHGVPVGVKDIFDTADMPTEDGTPLHAGRRPTSDAAAVSLLRQAGAVILGKTVTTELAVYAPGKTRNPVNPEHTPGGSSSGSAAAVADRMVPLALGSQSNGSTIRPASYCGVFGFKPSFGLVSRHGALKQSRPLDQVGVFARTLEDLALMAENLMVFDDRDPDMRPRARFDLVEAARRGPPVEPTLAFVKSPVWDQADAETREAFDELVESLGERVREVALPAAFDGAVAWHRTIMEADIARSFEREYETGKDKLSATLREMIERGRTITAVDYNRAVDRMSWLYRLTDPVFEWQTAILTPATRGPAPKGLDHTGSPIFCTLWTYLGMPAVSVPLFEAENGMPFGAQVVGSRGDDARVLQVARWLVDTVRR
jgi:Asp-tRNA(Asn)/Glu-tRNA(Gln) amidotransferase A subunit family amidase